MPAPSPRLAALPRVLDRPPAGHLVVALLVVALLGAATGRAATRAAMMPLQAEALLPSARDALERDVRAALAARGVVVQPAEETRAHIEEGARSGLDCPLTLEDCAVRVGLIADVDVVVTAAVEVIEERTLLRAAWLDVRGRSPRRIAGALVLPSLDGGASLRNLVGLLVDGQGQPAPVPVHVEVDPPTSALAIDGRSAAAGLVWLRPGAHVVRAEAPGRISLERTVEVTAAGDDDPILLALQPLPIEEPFPVGLAAGIGVGITGTVVGALAGAVALVIENDLAQVMPKDERQQRQSFGLAAVVVAGLGGALAVTGAGLSLAAVGDAPAHAAPGDAE